QHRNLRILIKPFLQNALGAQRVAAMRQRHLGGKIGEKQRLFDRGVAAADHQDVLAAIEKAVAGGAGGYAIAAEFLLRRQIEPARLGAGRKNKGVGEVNVAGIASKPKWTARQIDLVDVIGN